MDDSLNVFGGPLESCGTDPMTGFFRDGCCNTSAADGGSHTLCAQLTLEFLQYSLSRGNDLMTPRPEYGFAGLKPGDRWCLCVSRWAEAEQAGAAPPVILASTHQRALERVSLELLQKYAANAAS